MTSQGPTVKIRHQAAKFPVRAVLVSYKPIMAVGNFNYQLIDLVESNPTLYDMGMVSYKDDGRKQAIWADIADTVNESVDTCRRRWKSFRTRFRKEFVRLESLKHRGQPCAGKWEYFDRLCFLEHHLRPRESTDNIDLERIATKSEQDDENGHFSDSRDEHDTENDVRLSFIQATAKDNSSLAAGCRKRKRASSLSDAAAHPSVTPDILEAPGLILLPARTASTFASSRTTAGHALTQEQKQNMLFECSPSNLNQSQRHNKTFTKQSKNQDHAVVSSDTGDDCIDAFAQLVVAKMRKLNNTATAEVRIIMVLNEELDKEMHA